MNNYGVFRQYIKWRWPQGWLCLVFVLLVAFLASGCLRQQMPKPEKFIIPIENRLILGMPFFTEEAGDYSKPALATVMSYHGRPVAVEDLTQIFGKRKISVRRIVDYARKKGFKTERYNGSPRDLVEAVRQDKPLIVRLGADASPLKKGNYAVIVGFNQLGVVVNSIDVHQQIINWSDFLTAWLQDSNFTLKIEAN